MKSNQIKIDITDWVEEHDKLEPDLSTKDKLIEQVTTNQLSTSQAAALTIAARERGLTPDDILPANKMMLLTGGMVSVSSLIARQRRKVRLENGAEATIRAHVAPVGESGEEGQVSGDTHLQGAPSPAHSPAQGFAPSVSAQGVQNALEYLRRYVPGYIEGRLTIIAAGGGDVEGAAEELIETIRVMVKRLREPLTGA